MSQAPLPAQRAPEAFFQAQKRNRRATWRMSLLSMLAAFIMGVPLTLVLTPLVYAATLAIAEVVNYFSPLAPEFWENIELVARILQQVNGALTSNRSIDSALLGFAAAVVLLPGMVVALVLWMSLRTLLHRGGVGGMLATLEARLPDRNDLKELQLADVVEEMSIAAGLPPPRVMLLDAGGANAAVFGTSAMDARIVLSRRLLDDLTRDQLQGVLGHLISSIGNGDLSIAFTVTSVFETSGLLVTLINLPFGSQSRGTVWRLIRYSFSSRTSVAGSDSEADQLAALLTRNMNSQSDDIDRFYDSSQTGVPLWRKFLRMVFFPMIFTNAAIKMSLWFFSYIMLGPAMALLWRTRRYLADAGAVQLTRSADGLASALQALNADDTSIPGGGWAAHLFLMNPGNGRSTAKAGLQGQSMLSFHPPLKRRLKRLQRMGAHVEFGTAPSKPLWVVVLTALLWLLLAPLMALAFAAVLAGIVMMIGLNLLFLALWLTVIHFIFTLIGHR
jgi:Zn-dependent protease with chaperone function